MKQNIPCELIRDLLPLYVDGLTSEVSNREIKEHLETCGSCRDRYERMKREMEGEETAARTEKTREIDYLKKVRRRGLQKIFLTAAGILAAAALGILVKLFVIGFPVDSYMITYTDVYEDTVHFGGVFYGSAECYSRYRLVEQEDGTQKLVIYGTLPSPWNRDGAFNLEAELPEPGGALEIGGIRILSDGTMISKLAGDLYRAKNPYIGDASADGRLAGALGIGAVLGSYKNELQTSAEPYGWTLNFEDGVSNSAVFEAQMERYACVLLALTGNLGEVSFSYTVETESGPVKRERTVTEQECEKRLGAPVKSFGESPERVQEMLDILGLEGQGM